MRIRAVTLKRCGSLFFKKENNLNRDELLQVGVITTPHGVHGEVNVFPTTDDPRRFKKLKNVILDDGKNLREIEISGVKFFKQLVILKFKDIDDRNEVEKLRKCPLLVTRENAVSLGKDEYFVADMIGLKVYEEGTEVLIGTITDVIETGANDVYEIKLDSAYMPGGKTPKDEMAYAPAIKECIKEVDVKGGRLTMFVMPGLIDVV